MEKIPIVIDGVTCGQGRLQREGAYLVFRGRAKWQGDMVRLWLYGRGEPAYVGVLQPDGTVRKRFGATEYAALPQAIDRCANLPPQAPLLAHREEDVLWYAQGDGTLLRQEGARTYVAFPACDLRMPRGCEGVRREIEGTEYVIFPC